MTRIKDPDFNTLFEGAFADERGTLTAPEETIEPPPSFDFHLQGEHDQAVVADNAGHSNQKDHNPYSGLSEIPEGELGNSVRTGFNAIREVHNLPEGLTSIPVRSNDENFSVTTTDEILIDKNSKTPSLTFVHEFGHHLDSHFSGGLRNDPRLDEVTRETAPVRLHNAAGPLYSLRKGKNEVWARAYAQWVAQKSSIDKVKNDSNKRRPPATRNNDDYWSDEEFSRISPVVENILSDRGVEIK